MSKEPEIPIYPKTTITSQKQLEKILEEASKTLRADRLARSKKPVKRPPVDVRFIVHRRTAS